MARMYTQGMEIVPGFRLVKPLGRGGFGEVWKATAPGGTEVAIKIISLGERYGFKEFRAVQLVKQVRHPNLVPIVAFWLVNEEGKLFQDMAGGDQTMARKAQDLDLIIAMGLGDKNLIDRLKECQKEGKPGIPSEELLSYMEDAAKAIDYLNQPIHDLGDGVGGINHCDIKPQNILIVGGAAQVCDFGLARVLGDTRVTSAKGSAAYMAPEMITENKPTRTTDQYFLAISYIELRTGSLPIAAASPAAAIWAHVQGKLDLSKLAPAEQEVMRKAAAVKPDQRYDTTMEMVRALRQAIEGGGPSQKGSRVIKLDELVKPGSEVVPGYKLIRMLGKGGYGQVWEATAPGGKKVALKVIKNLEGVHGRQEFKALELIKGVDHNHLMELHAYWLLDRKGNIIPDEERDRPDAPEASTLVIASKLANKNLLQRLGECFDAGLTGIPLPELLGYMRQAAQAIDYLNTMQHDLGDRKVSIQHRDIKPENILLAADVVKVGDFGLAKVVEGTSAVIHGDSAGLTLAYAAPEMFTNLVTSWTDQYCLALTYFKLRTGGWPFPETSKPNEIIKSHIMGKLDLSKLGDAERPVIAHATAVKPDQRFPSCLAMVEELERVCDVPANAETGGASHLAAELARRGHAEHAAGNARRLNESSARSASPQSGTLHDASVASPFGTLAPAEPKPDMTETLAVKSDLAVKPELSPSDTSLPVHTPPSDSEAPTLTHNPNRPATSDRIIVPTRDQLELPPETKSSRPPTLQAIAWKDAKKPKAKAVGKGVSAGVKVAVMLLVVVGGAGAAVYGTWDQWAPRLLDRTASVKTEVDSLIAARQYADALARTDSWGVQADVAHSLKDSIRVSWNADARKELIEQQDYDGAAATAQALLDKYPDDAEAQQTLASARLAGDIKAALAKTRDFAALDQKLAAASDLEVGVRKSLRAELARGWLDQARKELFEERDFVRARDSAAALNKIDDNAEAKKIERQASLALEVVDLVKKDKMFEKADRTLDLAGTELREDLRKGLRGDVLRAWLDEARQEFRDKNYDKAARTTTALLARFPQNPEALIIRKEMSRELLRDSQNALAMARARLWHDSKMDVSTKQMLTRAIASAEKAYKSYQLDDPQVFVIQAKANELLDKPADALAAYEAGLPEPRKATSDQLPLLIARVEFFVNPQWEKYRRNLGFENPRLIDRVIEAADRAFELSTATGLDATTRAHAIALGALARVYYLNKVAKIDPVKVEQLRDIAIARLRTALAQASEDDDSWRWRYELAAQLRGAMLAAKPADRAAMRGEAVKLLHEASRMAPTRENDTKITPLLKELGKVDGTGSPSP